MSDFMQSINERTHLAGSNHLEAILFTLGEDRNTGKTLLFGINVFKVRELMAIPDITPLPKSQSCLEGVVTVRGQSIPVINLPGFCGIETDDEPRILIITEYNGHVQGLLAREVETIERLAWEDIKSPPISEVDGETSLVTGVYQMENDRVLMLLDVEKVLADVIGVEEEQDVSYVPVNSLKGTTVFFSDDSEVARRQIIKVLNHMGANHILATDGGEAWAKLRQLARHAEREGHPLSEDIQCIITDVEMPKMDGYVLTKKIKADVRFNNIPVIMHSSLSTDGNKYLGQGMGVDAYVPKLNVDHLSRTLLKLLLKKPEEKVA